MQIDHGWMIISCPRQDSILRAIFPRKNLCIDVADLLPISSSSSSYSINCIRIDRDINQDKEYHRFIWRNFQFEWEYWNSQDQSEECSVLLIILLDDSAPLIKKTSISVEKTYFIYLLLASKMSRDLLQLASIILFLFNPIFADIYLHNPR